MDLKYRELHRITSTAIIEKNGKYLIVQRVKNKKAFPGRWTVPGGGLEVDDYIDLPKTSSDAWYFAIEESLKREVREEVSIEIKNIKYLCDLTFLRPDGIPCIVLSYFCNWKSGEVKLNEENMNAKWVTVEEAKNYDLISGILEEIEMTHKIMNGGKVNKQKLKTKIDNNNND